MEDGLTIDQVAKATGLKAGTLRMWELRYGWPRPERQPNGYRIYPRHVVPLIMRVVALIYGPDGKPGRYMVSDILRDGFPSWPSSGPIPAAQSWTRYAQIPPAHPGAAAGFRLRLDVAMRQRRAAAVVEMMHEANITLRPHERLVAAWLPGFFGAMEWMHAGRPLAADIARVIGRVAGGAVLADVVARWQTAEAIG
jgi:hypothetical protein